MQASVKIMDIDIDMLSNDILIDKMNEYLKDDHLDVIFFASAELLDRAVDDEKYHELIDKAELFLPGEEALLSNHHVDVLEAGGMVVSCKSFGLVLENLKKQDRTIYIVSESENDTKDLVNYCKHMQPELQVVGSCIYSEDIEDAAIVNDINTCSPDMIIVDLKTGLQESWIMAHVPLLNARICVAKGGVADLILAEEKNVPGWVKKLHLTWFYEKIVIEQLLKKGFRARIFRKKIANYNNHNDETKESNSN